MSHSKILSGALFLLAALVSITVQAETVAIKAGKLVDPETSDPSRVLSWFLGGSEEMWFCVSSFG